MVVLGMWAVSYERGTPVLQGPAPEGVWRLRQKTMHVAGDVCEDLELAPGQEVSVALQTSVALHASQCLPD